MNVDVVATENRLDGYNWTIDQWDDELYGTRLPTPGLRRDTPIPAKAYFFLTQNRESAVAKAQYAPYVAVMSEKWGRLLRERNPDMYNIKRESILDRYGGVIQSSDAGLVGTLGSGVHRSYMTEEPTVLDGDEEEDDEDDDGDEEDGFDELDEKALANGELLPRHVLAFGKRVLHGGASAQAARGKTKAKGKAKVAGASGGKPVGGAGGKAVPKKKTPAAKKASTPHPGPPSTLAKGQPPRLSYVTSPNCNRCGGLTDTRSHLYSNESARCGCGAGRRTDLSSTGSAQCGRDTKTLRGREASDCHRLPDATSLSGAFGKLTLATPPAVSGEPVALPPGAVTSRPGTFSLSSLRPRKAPGCAPCHTLPNGLPDGTVPYVVNDEPFESVDDAIAQLNAYSATQRVPDRVLVNTPQGPYKLAKGGNGRFETSQAFPIKNHSWSALGFNREPFRLDV